MTHPFVLSAACAAALSLLTGTCLAQSHNGIKPSMAHPAAKSHGLGLNAAAGESTEIATPVQLEIAQRVLTGEAQCEFNQRVSVQPIEDKPGFFRVMFKSASYTMAPQATTTGAVRLEDKHAGVMWLQIPTKSMLLDNKVGHRLVDSCTQTQQRASL
jgi:hypothetical protein